MKAAPITARGCFVEASAGTGKTHTLVAEIAAAIETRFPDLAAQHPELLAHHYAAAGAPKSAIRLLDQASRAARDRSAHAEAAAHERAARRLEEQSESERTG